MRTTIQPKRKLFLLAHSNLFLFTVTFLGFGIAPYLVPDSSSAALPVPPPIIHEQPLL